MCLKSVYNSGLEIISLFVKFYMVVLSLDLMPIKKFERMHYVVVVNNIW